MKVMVDWQRPLHSPVPLSVIGKGLDRVRERKNLEPNMAGDVYAASMVIVSVGRWAVRQASSITLGSRPVAALPACDGQSV